MTQFDYAIVLVFAVSALMGFLRGASREVVTVLALTLGAMGALFGLPFVAPMARKLVNPDWLGTVGAGVALFLVIYVALRFFGGLAVQRIQRTQVLGALDRSVGLAFGLVRAFVFIGALSLAFSAATPAERIPGWVSGAKLYPLATASGRLLAAFAPKGRDLAERMKPGLSDARRDSARDSGPDGSYDARERRQIDDLVEKSR
jgi:membrane protein required for colicin V production